jgi:hypothetical protein
MFSKIRYIIIVGFICLIQKTVAAQSNNMGSWFVYFGNQKINDRWNIQSDFQYRDYRLIGQRNQFLARAGLGYNLKPQNHNLLLGYAYIATDTYDENDLNKTTKIENRIFQQYLFKNKVGNNYLTHRFRLEERFLPSTFGLRARYFIAFQKSFRAHKKSYFSTYNEFFYDLKSTKFDRNRLYGGIGMILNQSIKLETGYMIQVQENNTRGQLQLILFNNLPFKKTK